MQSRVCQTIFRARQSLGTRYSCASQSCFNETIPRATGIRIEAYTNGWGESRQIKTVLDMPREPHVASRAENPVSEMSFLLAIFAIIEHLNKSELTTTSKKLIINYVNEASGESMVEKARAAVHRYTQIVLPTLDALKEKARTMKLDPLDHLVLKLEYQASRLRT
jgi:hypothetical protein